MERSIFFSLKKSYLSPRCQKLPNMKIQRYKENKAIKDGGSTAGLPPNNKQKDHQSN